MSEIENVNKCGRCRHFKRDPENLMRGLCIALPPTPTYIHVRGPGGGPMPQPTGIAWPIVESMQDACGVHFKLHLSLVGSGQ